MKSLNCTRFIAALLTAWLLSGCQATQVQPPGPELLVTFAVDRFHDLPEGISGGNYYREDKWRGSLHTRARVRRVRQGFNLIQVDAWPIETLGVHCVLFRAPRETDVPKLIKRLEAHTQIAAVQLNHAFKPLTTRASPGDAFYDDPLFQLQYGRHTAVIERLHAITTGERSKVGVIDSNVDLQHPDLSGQIARRYLIAGEAHDQTHGTAMAGIIGARADNGVGVVGIAPAARLYAYGACGTSNGRTICRSFDLAKAIVQAIEDQVQVLNMSLAGPADLLLAQLLERAVQEHNMIVIAARNDGNPDQNFPASLDYVHAPPAENRGWFVRHAQMSTQAGGGYQVFFGPSVATAGVSGIAALLRSKSTMQESNALLHALLNSGCYDQQVQARIGKLGLASFCE